MITNKRTERIKAVILNTFFILLSAVFIIPLLSVVFIAFTSEQSISTQGYPFFFREIDLTAFQYILDNPKTILDAYKVTILVSFGGTAIYLLLASMAAYALSRPGFKWKRQLTFFFFFTMLFNGGLVPTYLMYVKYLHIKNTIWALIVPGFLLSANNVLMIRSYFNTSIPDALFEAAKIDGAGHMKIFTSITLPLGKPILVTMGLFSALGYWNDWTNGLYYLSGNEGQKLYSIQNLLNQMITDIQYLASGKVTGNIGAEVAKLPTTSIRMAIAFIAMLPLFIIYPFLQKYFAEGITLGAVKG